MNGIYLYLLLREVRETLIGLYIDDITYKDRLVQIVCGRTSLFASLYPEAPVVYVAAVRKDGFKRLTKFYDALEASRIIGVEQPHFMPVVRLRLEKIHAGAKHSLDLVLSLYREAPNVGIKTPRTQKNLFPRYIEKQPKKSILDLTAEQLNALTKSEDPIRSAEALVKEIEGIDKFCARELTYEHIEKLKDILRGRRVRPRVVSILPLRISLFASDYIHDYPSLNEAVEASIESFMMETLRRSIRVRRQALIKSKEKQIERLQKRCVPDADIEEYRIKGELILAHMTRMKKGSEEVRVLNRYTQQQCSIALDPLKTPQENAQAYFSRYKRLKRGQPHMKKKIEELTREIERLKKEPLQLPATGEKSYAPRKKSTPFRSFDLASGSVVYVGKNVRSNETLTFHSARPHDYFFHVRGFEGAHTILKATVPKGQRPRKEDIETAASIAAYFSKARHQTKVPVSYTQRKYLKKNKKGKPGSVILMREKVIFVDPQLPKE
jgi:predicted ribosome quality control (RQC) complex YloA/Tae2 family protein